ncbi:hypothetical protein ABN034_31335 [Actinopolymorpha sp. B11F2]|uniref:hypothetical protein n=1 Tax=Actinopolymorpha sp. B11F2 TaxID=3160862 RepID=UPI0032E4FD11
MRLYAFMTRNGFMITPAACASRLRFPPALPVLPAGPRCPLSALPARLRCPLSAVSSPTRLRDHEGKPFHERKQGYITSEPS